MRDFLDISIRGITILIKVIFTLLSAKYLSESDYGFLIFFITLTSYLVYFNGLDFFTFLNRKYFRNEITLKQNCILSLKFVLIIYFVTLLIAYLIFPINYNNFYFYFIGILLLEVVSSEILRLIRSIGNVTTYNILNLFKSSLWMLVFSLYFLYEQYVKLNVAFNLYLLFSFWFIFLIFTILIAIIRLKINIIDFLLIKFDRKAIIEFFKKYFIKLYITSLGRRTLISIDKIILPLLLSFTYSGIYSFYNLVGFSFLMIVDAGVIARLYPVILKNHANKEVILKNFFIFFKKITIFLILFLCSYNLLIKYILVFIDKPNMSHYSFLGNYFILAYYFYCLSYFPFYYFFAKNFDSVNLFTTLVSIILFLTLFILSTNIYSITIAFLFTTIMLNFFYIFQLRRLKFEKF